MHWKDQVHVVCILLFFRILDGKDFFFNFKLTSVCVYVCVYSSLCFNLCPYFYFCNPYYKQDIE